jgi:hypothetical protein
MMLGSVAGNYATFWKKYLSSLLSEKFRSLPGRGVEVLLRRLAQTCSETEQTSQIVTISGCLLDRKEGRARASLLTSIWCRV